MSRLMGRLLVFAFQIQHFIKQRGKVIVCYFIGGISSIDIVKSMPRI
ncbi:hypothetical protein [Treponema endosymbiont of Eucomonympha sp.]|nr:hypothetical protein [Treponema endosymbiont of Eucomonympha sp.]